MVANVKPHEYTTTLYCLIFSIFSHFLLLLTFYTSKQAYTPNSANKPLRLVLVKESPPQRGNSLGQTRPKASNQKVKPSSTQRKPLLFKETIKERAGPALKTRKSKNKNPNRKTNGKAVLKPTKNETSEASNITSQAARNITPPAPHPTQLIPNTFIKPQYTPLALEVGLEGVFQIEVEIDTNGDVLAAKLLRQVGYGMDQKIITAALGAKFTPSSSQHELAGKPRKSFFTIHLSLY